MVSIEDAAERLDNDALDMSVELKMALKYADLDAPVAKEIRRTLRRYKKNSSDYHEYLAAQKVQCPAVLHCGPGHQSKRECYVKGPHEIHCADYQGLIARWKGMSASTGFFGEVPEVDDL